MKLYPYFYLLFFFGITACVSRQDSNSRETSSDRSIVQDMQTQNKAMLYEESPVFHASHEPKKLDAPFSDAVQVGNVFYLSGQIGIDHSLRELVGGGIQAETRQTLENIKAVLFQHSLSMSDVVKATVILDDIEDFSAFNEIYVSYFPQKPARTTFAAETLARGAKIEIEVVAVRTSH